jgi:hypothetical protein
MPTARVKNQLTNSALNELPGDWSPDMKYAVVDYFSFTTTEDPPISDLAVVDLSNGTVTKLTNTEEVKRGGSVLGALASPSLDQDAMIANQTDARD